jgi:hypothetical protein
VFLYCAANLYEKLTILFKQASSFCRKLIVFERGEQHVIMCEKLEIIIKVVCDNLFMGGSWKCVSEGLRVAWALLQWNPSSSSCNMKENRQNHTAQWLQPVISHISVHSYTLLAEQQ